MRCYVCVTRLPENQTAGGMFIECNDRSEISDIVEQYVEFPAALIIMDVKPEIAMKNPPERWNRYFTQDELQIMFGPVSEASVVDLGNGKLQVYKKGVVSNPWN